MRKIKDLGMMFASNALSTHPIDEERYDLFVSALSFVAFLNRGFRWDLSRLELGNDKDWLEAVHSSLEQASRDALAIDRQVARYGSYTTSLAAADRAERLNAMFRRDGHDVADLYRTIDGDPEGLLLQAWFSVLRTLYSSPGFLTAEWLWEAFAVVDSSDILSEALRLPRPLADNRLLVDKE